MSSSDSGCLHCGLPTSAGDAYCCYGCELASQIAREAEQDHSRLRGQLTFAALLTMSIMMLSLFLYAEDIYGAPPEAGFGWMRSIYRVFAAILATPVMALCGLPLARRAARRLAERRLSMDALIATGAFAAYGLSIFEIVTGGSRVYFDSATGAVVLATFGRYLEAIARSRASKTLGPSMEVVREPVRAFDGGVDLGPLAPSQIRPGMELWVDVERVVPVDLVLRGETVEVDLGVISGESAPVRRTDGEVVPAGAVAVSGPLRGEALRSARDSTLERLAELARNLRERPSRLQRVADAFASTLTPLVWAAALATFTYWMVQGAGQKGVIAALAVVLAACPCTYAIATPLIHWLALRRALARGVLIRDAAALEELARVDTVAFDKTGTLTAPPLRVLGITTAPNVDRREALGLVAALEAGSPHPIARALAACAAGSQPEPLQNRRFEVGEGVVGTDPEGRRVGVGSPRLLRRLGVVTTDHVAVAREGGGLLATFEIGESVRPEASEAVAELRDDGIGSVILTGDTRDRAEQVAEALGVPVHAELSAAEKVTHLRELGLRAAMVGDGLNDAPALAGAGPSFAVEGSTGLARGMARVTLLDSDLRLVPWTLGMARHAMRNVRWLLGVSTAYNLVFVSLAAAGALRPVFAGLSMLVSSLVTLAFAATAGERKRR